MRAIARIEKNQRHTLTLWPDSVKPAPPDAHRRRGATQARPRRRRTASHVRPASPGWSYDVPRLCRRRVRASSMPVSSSTSLIPMALVTLLGRPSVWVSGETIDESIALRYRKYTFINHSMSTKDWDTCGLRIFTFQNQGAHRARVPSPPVHAWMLLASDMRARLSNDRLGPHAYGHCASVGGECAIGACRSRRWKRTVGRADRARV